MARLHIQADIVDIRGDAPASTDNFVIDTKKLNLRGYK